MSKPQTRAQYLGIMPGKLSARTARRVAKIRTLLTEIAVDWMEADSAVEFDCDQIRDRMDELDQVIAEGLEQLRGPAPE